MTPEFQSDLLKFLFQNPKAKRFIPYVSPDLFDNPAQESVYGVFRDYIKKYKRLPSKASYIEFLNREVNKSRESIDESIHKNLLNETAKAYSRLDGGTELIEDVLIEEIQKKLAKRLIVEYAEKIKKADDTTFNKMLTQMGKIVKLREDILNERKEKGMYFIRDASKNLKAAAVGQPIFLHGVNRMTAAGGFYSPQLITFMAGPKFFKTGVLLNIAWDLAIKGKKLFYADSENGEDNINVRLRQCVLQCTRNDTFKYMPEFNAIVAKVGKMGGEIRIEFFPKNSTLDDVEQKMLELRNEDGFVPDVIIYDYLDLYKSSDKKIIDKRLHIQDVYHHAVRINERWNTFAFTVSTVKASAINKLIVEVGDFGEDSQKAYNCHAAFAICRTKTEMQEGTARIVPVVQREGVGFRNDAATTCAVQFNESIMNVKELDSEAYMFAMRDRLEKDVAAASVMNFKAGRLKDE